MIREIIPPLTSELILHSFKLNCVYLVLPNLPKCIHIFWMLNTVGESNQVQIEKVKLIVVKLNLTFTARSCKMVFSDSQHTQDYSL